MSEDKTPDATDIFVGMKMRDFRRRIEMSQTELGNRIGVTFQQVQKYERGANRVSASMLFRACEVLGREPNDFFPDRDKPVSAQNEDLLRNHAMGPVLGTLQEIHDQFPGMLPIVNAQVEATLNQLRKS